MAVINHPAKWPVTIFLALLAVVVVCTIGVAYAQTSPPTVNINPTAQMDGMLNLIYNSSRTWTTTLYRYAISLFWGLALIQFIWTFFPLVFRQADFAELIGALVRFVLVIGFFAALLHFSKGWTGAIVDSFQELGFITFERSGAGDTPEALAGRALHPGLVFGRAIEVAYDIGEIATATAADPAAGAVTQQVIFFAILTIVMCFVFIAGFMALALIESWMVINVSVLFMGLGGSEWTRHYARQMLTYAVSVGVKLFVMTLLIGLVMSSFEKWRAELVGQDTAVSAIWTAVGLSMLAAFFVKTIPELAQSLITGAAAGGSSVGAMEGSAMQLAYSQRSGGGLMSAGGMAPGSPAPDGTMGTSMRPQMLGSMTMQSGSNTGMQPEISPAAATRTGGTAGNARSAPSASAGEQKTTATPQSPDKKATPAPPKYIRQLAEAFNLSPNKSGAETSRPDDKGAST